MLIDGGTGSEIERQGVEMNEMSWCGIAHMEHPDVVRKVHESYIAAGADVIIANTFSTAPHILEQMGLEDDVQRINADAVRLALEARESAGDPSVCVAASISSIPPFQGAQTLPTGDRVKYGYKRQAEYLAEAGAELICAEMMMDIDNASLVVDAASATGLPVWVGFSVSVDDQGNVASYDMGDKFDIPVIDFVTMAKEVLAIGGQAAGIMHSSVHDIARALELLNTVWDGPTYAYAESGHFESPSWKFVDIIDPALYVDYANKWIDLGVNMIGGCCGTGPEHIRALADELK